jgi:hypothetical protein
MVVVNVNKDLQELHLVHVYRLLVERQNIITMEYVSVL